MEKDVIEYQVSNVKNGDDERFERKINQSPNNNSVNHGNLNNNINSTSGSNTTGQLSKKNNTVNNNQKKNINGVRSIAPQRFSGGNIKDLLNKKNSSNSSASERIKNKVGQKALSTINPALGAASSMLSGNDNNSGQNVNDENNISNQSSNGSTLDMVAKVSTGKKLKLFALIGSSGFLFISFVGVILLSSIIYHKIGGIKLSDNISAADTNLQNNLQENAHKVTDDGFDAGLDDSAYLDIYDDNQNSGVKVLLVSKSGDVTFDNLTDMYGGNYECNEDNSKCISDADKRFFLKMYDLYYLYLSKYNVKLDLSLIMATLTYNSTNIAETMTMNLSYYDRKEIVENDWNPTTVTELDWDYDYVGAYNILGPMFGGDGKYIFANDSAYDMQILAKNMVTKTTEKKCKKNSDDGNSTVITKTKRVKDVDEGTDEDLICNDGESLVLGKATYELDLDKYDRFLPEYIESKYYDKVNIAIPHYYLGFQEIYYTDKVPTVLTNRGKKSSSTSSSTDTVNLSSSEIINRLNEIALGEVGNGGATYRKFLWKEDNGYDWCAAFIAWLYDKVGGINKLIIPNGFADDTVRNSYNMLGGKWFEDECYDSTSVPQAGDIILFDPIFGGISYPWPDNGKDQFFSSHIGYIYKVDDEKIYTVEGNTGGGDGIVQSKEYSRKYCGFSSHQGINGYYRPNYSSMLVESNVSGDSPSTSSYLTTSGGFKGKIHYYNQGNYSAYSFGGYGSIQSHGCGPTSLAIVISSLLNEEHDPVEVTNKLCELGHCTNSGATLYGITATAEAYGMKVDYNSNTQDVVKALKSGNALVVAITNGGLIISDGVQLSYGGHYIVLTGVDSNGQITIADPGNSANNNRTLDIEALSKNSNNRPDSPSFWIITK